MIEKNILMMFLVVILIISSISAIRINEVELNPENGKSGIEWVELYNDEDDDVDISKWEIYDGLASPRSIGVMPKKTIIEKEGYYIVEVQGTKLNNGGDFVTLYDISGKKIDETKILKETTSSSKTWQLCSSWEFTESTKGEKNDCKKEVEENEEDSELKESTILVGGRGDEVGEDTQEEEKPKNTELEIIKLNTPTTKDIKTEDDKKNLDKRDYAKYGFVVFCILLGFLFVFKKRRFNKNEFNE